MKKVMDKIFGFIVRFRYFFLAGWGALFVVSLLLIPSVTINYDSTTYLPKDSETKEALRIMEEEFGLKGQAILLLENVTIEEAINQKENLSDIKYVSTIFWLDDFIEKDMLDTIQNLIPGDFPLQLDDALGLIPGLETFYQKKSALMQIMFTEDDHSLKTGDAIKEIKKRLERAPYNFALGGPAVSAFYMREITTSEVLKITLYVIPIVLLILFIFTNSWIEPLVFLLVVGISVLINMGTNVVFSSISFITNSTAALLQLAISMDYAIFLLHQYTKEREDGTEKLEAMKKAMSKSFLSISSSMLTTAAGFAALMFMRYKIGLDLSAVMIKGIVISLVATFTLLPVLILIFDKLLIKTKHRPFFPKLGILNKIILKMRYVVPAIALVVIGPAFIAQSNNHFVYGEQAMSTGEGSEGAQYLDLIEKKFGKQNMSAILVPNKTEDDLKRQMELIDILEDKLTPYSPVIQSYLSIKATFDQYDFLPDDIVENFIPDEFITMLESENYSRIIVILALDSESPEAFAAMEIMETQTIGKFGNRAYVVGTTSAVKEIKDYVTSDYIIVEILSIVLVLVILIVSFRSLSLPVMLVFTIQLSVWINMSVPFLLNDPLIFIGFIIVSAIQLGATIDYGILLTQHYIDGRAALNKRAALKYALDNSGHSILTSGLILTAAGYTLSFFSGIEGIASMGHLIGRGAALSIVLVLVLMPQLLYRLDTVVLKTTRKLDFIDSAEEERPPSLFDGK
ncbi:MAG TPA: MMPL family transporter [Bacilli bacterium]|nr:MMPL family transporter [Bacilli bacterium]